MKKLYYLKNTNKEDILIVEPPVDDKDNASLRFNDSNMNKTPVSFGNLDNKFKNNKKNSVISQIQKPSIELTRLNSNNTDLKNIDNLINNSKKSSLKIDDKPLISNIISTSTTDFQIKQMYRNLFNDSTNYFNVNSNIILTNKPVSVDNQKTERDKELLNEGIKIRSALPKPSYKINTVKAKTVSNLLNDLAPIEASKIKSNEQKHYEKNNKQKPYSFQKATSTNHKLCLNAHQEKMDKVHKKDKEAITYKKGIFLKNLNNHVNIDNTFDRRDWIPEKLKKKLNTQRLNLNSANKFSDDCNSMVNRISSKIKRDPNQLLINNIDYTRVKKELTSIIDQNYRQEEKFGNFLWYVKLRKSDNINFKNDFPNKVYVNKGLDKSIWGVINDTKEKDIELLRRPQTGTMRTNHIDNHPHLSYYVKNLINEYKNEYFNVENKENQIINLEKFINSEKILNINGVNLKQLENQLFDKEDFLLCKKYEKDLVEVQPNIDNIEETIY